jgi:hypothetical protein
LRSYIWWEINFKVTESCNFYFSQSLLSDREKLCQLLEQNPKLMQMLQVNLCEMSEFGIFKF